MWKKIVVRHSIGKGRALVLLSVFGALIGFASDHTVAEVSCDLNDIKCYLEVNNFFGYLGKDPSSVNYTWGKEWSLTRKGQDLPLSSWDKYVEVILENMTITLYWNTLSGQVYYSEPSKVRIPKIDSAVMWEINNASEGEKIPISVGYFDVTEERLETLRSAGFDVNETQMERVRNLSRELGYKVYGYNKAYGSATKEGIYRIAELDFVGRILFHKLYHNLTTLYPVKRNVTILANSIDHALATDFFEYLDGAYVERHVNASSFDEYKDADFIILLGGPDAPEGVGDIVKQVLSTEEQNHLRVNGNRGLYIKTDVWSQGQLVHVIAGYNRWQTMLAAEENRDLVRAMKRK